MREKFVLFLAFAMLETCIMGKNILPASTFVGYEPPVVPKYVSHEISGNLLTFRAEGGLKESLGGWSAKDGKLQSDPSDSVRVNIDYYISTSNGGIMPKHAAAVYQINPEWKKFSKISGIKSIHLEKKGEVTYQYPYTLPSNYNKPHPPVDSEITKPLERVIFTVNISKRMNRDTFKFLRAISKKIVTDPRLLAISRVPDEFVGDDPMTYCYDDNPRCACVKAIKATSAHDAFCKTKLCDKGSGNFVPVNVDNIKCPKIVNNCVQSARLYDTKALKSKLGSIKLSNNKIEQICEFRSNNKNAEPQKKIKWGEEMDGGTIDQLEDFFESLCAIL